VFTWVILGVGFFFPTVYVLLVAKDRLPGNIGRIYLSYLLPLSVGLGGLFAFVGHTLRADEVALSIGWPTGNPFQTEVAMANLVFGVLGLLCVKFRDGFWTATILGYGVFGVSTTSTRVSPKVIGSVTVGPAPSSSPVSRSTIGPDRPVSSRTGPSCEV
jgi:hypothetical protein